MTEEEMQEAARQIEQVQKEQLDARNKFDKESGILKDVEEAE